MEFRPVEDLVQRLADTRRVEWRAGHGWKDPVRPEESVAEPFQTQLPSPETQDSPKLRRQINATSLMVLGRRERGRRDSIRRIVPFMTRRSERLIEAIRHASRHGWVERVRVHRGADTPVIFGR